MDNTSVATQTTRLQRGVRLFLERGQEIERTNAHTYRVPSCSGEGSYLVWLDFLCCTCPDHQTAKASGERCKHFHAAGIHAAKLRAARRRDAIGPLAGGEKGWGNTLRGLRDQRAGDPEVRARSLQKRGIRPEFVGAKPEPGV